MSDVSSLSDSVYEVGDEVKQIGGLGLAWFYGSLYVVGLEKEGILLSRKKGGVPLTDLSEEPRVFPPWKFRKIRQAA